MWSIRGVGPATLKDLEDRHGPPGPLLEVPVERWAGAVEWHGEAAGLLAQWGVLARVADALEARCRATSQVPIFPGDEAWPARLLEIDAPPVLFLRGPGAAVTPRRRVAVVGTRTPDWGAREQVKLFAGLLAEAGLGVVSGAAVGIDQAAHRGALQAKGESWAFMGAALDQIDAPQRPIAAELLAGGGSLFSQFPPGCRSNASTFIQRNTLISGASDAVLVARAPAKSGALYTAAAAITQQRPLLAMPGDPWTKQAAGCNDLLKGGARLCLVVGDVLEAVGLEGTLTPPAPPPPAPLDLGGLSPGARQVLGALDEGPRDFEALEAAAGVASGTLSAALVELELAGVVLQRPGRRYEKR